VNPRQGLAGRFMAWGQWRRPFRPFRTARSRQGPDRPGVPEPVRVKAKEE